MMENDDDEVKKCLRLYENRQRSDNYYPLIGEEIPEILAVTVENDGAEDPLNLQPPPPSVVSTKSFFENQSSPSDSDVSSLSEPTYESRCTRDCTRYLDDGLKNCGVRSKSPTRRGVSFDSGVCKLSGSDCIKRSILYANSNLKSYDFKNLPVILSASSSSEVEYPVDEDSANDGTYSIVDELPSDNEKTYSISDEAVSTDEEQQDGTLKRYSDSFDESESSGCLKRDNEDVYKYFERCAIASDKIEKSISNVHRERRFEDVVGKIIDNYHNLYSKHLSRRMSKTSETDSSCGSAAVKKVNRAIEFRGSEIEVPNVEIFSRSNCVSREDRNGTAEEVEILARVADSAKSERSSSFCALFDNLRVEENSEQQLPVALMDIILEPPDMFKSCNLSVEDRNEGEFRVEVDVNDNITVGPASKGSERINERDVIQLVPTNEVDHFLEPFVKHFQNGFAEASRSRECSNSSTEEESISEARSCPSLDVVSENNENVDSNLLSFENSKSLSSWCQKSNGFTVAKLNDREAHQNEPIENSEFMVAKNICGSRKFVGSPTSPSQSSNQNCSSNNSSNGEVLDGGKSINSRNFENLESPNVVNVSACKSSERNIARADKMAFILNDVENDELLGNELVFDNEGNERKPIKCESENESSVSGDIKFKDLKNVENEEYVLENRQKNDNARQNESTESENDAYMNCEKKWRGEENSDERLSNRVVKLSETIFETSEVSNADEKNFEIKVNSTVLTDIVTTPRENVVETSENITLNDPAGDFVSIENRNGSLNDEIIQTNEKGSSVNDNSILANVSRNIKCVIDENSKNSDNVEITSKPRKIKKKVRFQIDELSSPDDESVDSSALKDQHILTEMESFQISELPSRDDESIDSFAPKDQHILTEMESFQINKVLPRDESVDNSASKEQPILTEMESSRIEETPRVEAVEEQHILTESSYEKFNASVNAATLQDEQSVDDSAPDKQHIPIKSESSFEQPNGSPHAANTKNIVESCSFVDLTKIDNHRVDNLPELILNCFNNFVDSVVDVAQELVNAEHFGEIHGAASCKHVSDVISTVKEVDADISTLKFVENILSLGDSSENLDTKNEINKDAPIDSSITSVMSTNEGNDSLPNFANLISRYDENRCAEIVDMLQLNLSNPSRKDNCNAEIKLALTKEEEIAKYSREFFQPVEEKKCDTSYSVSLKESCSSEVCTNQIKIADSEFVDTLEIPKKDNSISEAIPTDSMEIFSHDLDLKTVDIVVNKENSIMESQNSSNLPEDENSELPLLEYVITSEIEDANDEEWPEDRSSRIETRKSDPQPFDPTEVFENYILPAEICSSDAAEPLEDGLNRVDSRQFDLESSNLTDLSHEVSEELLLENTQNLKEEIRLNSSVGLIQVEKSDGLLVERKPPGYNYSSTFMVDAPCTPFLETDSSSGVTAAILADPSHVIELECEEDAADSVSNASVKTVPDFSSITNQHSIETEESAVAASIATPSPEIVVGTADVVVEAESEKLYSASFDAKTKQSYISPSAPHISSELQLAEKKSPRVNAETEIYAPAVDPFDFLHVRGVELGNDGQPDGMPSVSSASQETGNRDEKRITERATAVELISENVVDHEGREVKCGTVHATDVLAGDDHDRGGSCCNDANECGCWESLSNDDAASSHLCKWGEIIRSPGSSRLDSTGYATPELLCALDVPRCREYEVTRSAAAARDLIFVDRPDGDDHGAGVSNLEVIREFSDYFTRSLETDSKLREGIADLCLDAERGDCPTATECVFDSLRRRYNEDDEKKDDERDQVTSFVFSSSASSESDDEESSNMKTKKKGVSGVDEAFENDSQHAPSVLKSALKRGSKKSLRKKHRVQFDESLNTFFEADYVILVRDDEYDDEYGSCECGNQFCYEGCYYEDEDDEEYDERSAGGSPFDFGAAFDPPMEFVDPVTLSPPDGYKDGCGPQPSTCEKSASTMLNSQENEASCKEEYSSHVNDENAASQKPLCSDTKAPVNSQSHYIVETITMTTVAERRIVQEANEQQNVGDVLPDKLNGGILKGGRLWRHHENDFDGKGGNEDTDLKAEDDKRSVKFVQEGIVDNDNSSCDENESHEKGEFMLTFKLGNRVVPCNSLKPNSAVRQLFPDPRFVNPPTPMSEVDCDDNLGKCEGKYLVTEESLRAFNEVNKRSVFATFSGKERYPYKDGNFTVHSDDEDIPQNDLIKKTIERNTLRRSLMRYPRGGNRRRSKKKVEPSLEERIKQLTCNIDEEQGNSATDNADLSQKSILQRTSPPGEERREETPRKHEKSAYQKLTDFLRSRSNNPQLNAAEQHHSYYQTVYPTGQPDLGIDMKVQGSPLLLPKKTGTNEARKQFLSSLAPLTACVTGQPEINYGNRDTLKLQSPGDRLSMISTTSTATEYSVGDIDEALSTPTDEKSPQPDVVADTPNADINQDELAMFVQQDADRIERIKKRYSSTPPSVVLDEGEHDDYGFNQRPSVRGIRPRFGSTTEMTQQTQVPLQSPFACPMKVGSHTTWPYYSAEGMETKIDKIDSSGSASPRNSLPTLQEEGYELGKQGAASSEYLTKLVWERSAAYYPRVSLQQPLKVDTGTCNNVHLYRLTPSDSMTEMAMPFKCEVDSRRCSGSNILQMKMSPVASTHVRLPVSIGDEQFAVHPLPEGTASVIRVGHGQPQTFRVPCPVTGPVQVHLLTSHPYETLPQGRSSQPIQFPQQVVVAKGAQASSMSSTSYYQLHSSPGGSTTAAPLKNAPSTADQARILQMNYMAAHPSPPISSLTSPSARVKSQNQLTERGIPEGAVSSSPAFVQDSMKLQPRLPISGANGSQPNKSGSVICAMKV